MFRLELSRDASRFVKKLDPKNKKRVTNALLEIAESPLQASNIKKLTNYNLYRKRLGDIRIIYEIFDDELIVYVVRIGNRGQIYRNL
ncbi:type II toxin-antitoxin system RelE family toxin [Lentibacillus daqui]|uniref:type II toxin-antitoxin system RelE family toxin n=1 Tax=Lentibacillus daqui TaxID=2911514 RepID=UPI0022B1F9A1|nr:type II toxin-antitoxin system RelE/ParE family toxin [Lentibacillus daqui]